MTTYTLYEIQGKNFNSAGTWGGPFEPAAYVFALDDRDAIEAFAGARNYDEHTVRSFYRRIEKNQYQFEFVDDDLIKKANKSLVNNLEIGNRDLEALMPEITKTVGIWGGERISENQLLISENQLLLDACLEKFGKTSKDTKLPITPLSFLGKFADLAGIQQRKVIRALEAIDLNLDPSTYQESVNKVISDFSGSSVKSRALESKLTAVKDDILDKDAKKEASEPVGK